MLPRYVRVPYVVYSEAPSLSEVRYGRASHHTQPMKYIRLLRLCRHNVVASDTNSGIKELMTGVSKIAGPQ
jgi:hypothetical protein